MTSLCDNDDMPISRPPITPEQLTHAEKIAVMQSLFALHPGQHIRNLLNEHGYVSMIGIDISGTKLYGVIYENQKSIITSINEIKPIGFRNDNEDKPLSQERKTDIDESIHKRIKDHQNQ